jgi:hypothetical protein
VTAPTPQYHNLERWPAAALSLNYHEGAAMLPSEAATPGLRSQALARDRLSITGLYAVAPPRGEESLSLIPYAACTYLPDSSVGFSHGSHGSCAGFAEESLPRRTRSAPR